MRKVLAFGAYDLIHLGHIYFLRKAKILGDCLIVSLTRDKIYQLQKNRRPLFTEKERKEILSSIKHVDKVVLGDIDLKKIADYNMVKKIKPDIIAVGYDQKTDIRKIAQISKKLRKNIRVVKIPSYQPNIFSSNKIKLKL